MRILSSLHLPKRFLWAIGLLLKNFLSIWVTIIASNSLVESQSRFAHDITISVGLLNQFHLSDLATKLVLVAVKSGCLGPWPIVSRMTEVSLVSRTDGNYFAFGLVTDACVVISSWSIHLMISRVLHLPVGHLIRWRTPVILHQFSIISLVSRILLKLSGWCLLT